MTNGHLMGSAMKKTIDFKTKNYYEYPNVANELNDVIQRMM